MITAKREVATRLTKGESFPDSRTVGTYLLRNFNSPRAKCSLGHKLHDRTGREVLLFVLRLGSVTHSEAQCGREESACDPLGDGSLEGN